MASISVANQEALTQEYLYSVIDYNPGTGIFTWKSRPPIHQRIRTWNTKYAGQKTGYLMNNGYLQITINWRRYAAHRLAWFYVYGKWPKDQIDHINSIKTDNRISNLREATSAQNCQHKCTSKTSKLGIKGVSLYVKGGCRKYVALMYIKNKVVRLGRYDTLEKARQAYISGAKKHYKEFAKF